MPQPKPPLSHVGDAPGMRQVKLTLGSGLRANILLPIELSKELTGDTLSLIEVVQSKGKSA
jgi:hypothetical protein